MDLGLAGKGKKTFLQRFLAEWLAKGDQVW